MPDPEVPDPRYWRRRAAAVREIATGVGDTVLRFHLERLAATYEDLAKLADHVPRSVEPG
ncbi:MAG: hypothetical protein ACM30I_00875 [Gemmatimonas sp.]